MNDAPETQAAEVVDAQVVEEGPPVAPGIGALVPTGGSTVAVTPQVQATELVARLDVIKEAAEKAMREGVDYGKVPGTNKDTLFKPGAEKLSVLFQLDVQLANGKVWGPGDHLTVISRATAFHAPSGTRLGYGEGVCTTRERKYAKRKQERTCPSCGAAAVIKGREEYGGGWLCFKKKSGCGAKWSDGDAVIESQEVGEIDNPDLPDLWNTVVKMAEKRARVDVVLAVTGASALFTQDMEDGAPGSAAFHDASATAATEPPQPKLAAERVGQIGKGIGTLRLTYKEIAVMLGACGVNGLPEESGDGLRERLESLTDQQATALEAALEKAAQDGAAEAPDEGEGADDA